MKTLNKIGALAVTAVMAGSLATVGLSALQIGEGVDAFVQLVKQHPEDTQVFVGSVADVSDAIAAANLVTAISKATEVPMVKGLCTDVIEPTLPELTGSKYPLEASGVSNIAFTTDEFGNKVLTPDTLSDVLKDYTISTYFDGANQKFRYSEQIVIPAMKVKYDEDDDKSGLFLDAEGDNFPYFKIDFEGNGLPTDADYKGSVEFTLLGDTYIFDLNELKNHNVVLFSGTEAKLNIGEEFEGVKLTGLSLDKDEIEVTVGEIKKDLYLGLAEKVGNKTILLKSVSKVWDGTGESYKASIMVANERLELVENEMFNDYEISEINFVGDYLKSISLKYDSDFDGSVDNGLAVKQVISGPKDLYKMVFEGFTSVDTTKVVMKGVNDDGKDIMQISWYDLDGKLNEFKPVNRDQVTLGTTFTDEVNMGFLDGHSLKFVKTIRNEDNYKAVFEIAGKEYTTNAVKLGENATLNYLTLNYDFNYDVLIVSAKEVSLNNVPNLNFAIGNSDMKNSPILDISGLLNFRSSAAVFENEELPAVYLFDDGMITNDGILINNYIDTAKDTVETNDKNHITAYGTEIVASGTEVTFTIPEEQRKVLVNFYGVVKSEPKQVCEADTPGKMFDVKSAQLDNFVSNANYSVVVGGVWVNELAKGMAGANITETDGSYLLVDGNKLLAAGMTGNQTIEAVDKLVELLKQ